MTLEQIYMLNRALDGEDIYSLPSFSNANIDGLSVSLYKDSLVDEGLLETHSSFTEKGLLLTKSILDFKNAKKYVTILDLVFGLIDDNEAVALECTHGDYTFTLVGIKDAVKQLTGVYKFLSLKSGEDTDGVPVSLKELAELYKLGKTNSFSLMTEQGEKATHEILFTDGKSIYVYDFLNEKLNKKSKGSVIKLLSERMAV